MRREVFRVGATLAVALWAGTSPTPPREALAQPRIQMEGSRIEVGGGLARGVRAQVEAGEVAAWAENLPPDPPSHLGVSGGSGDPPLQPGGATSSATLTLGFALADPDPGDTVRSVVEVSTRADFGVVIATTPRVSGLAEGWYWWRVKAVDAMGAESGWSTANGGDAAFGVDDDPPGAVVSTPTAWATVRVGEAITIAGQVSGADVVGWEVAITTGGAGGRKARPYAEGTNREVTVSWTPTGPAGVATIMLTARDAEGFRNTARVEVYVSTAGRPEGRPLRTAPGMAEAFGFRSAGVGPNPARAGAWVSGHLAVGRADAMRARLFTSAGELVANQDGSNPVWHGSDLCYEEAVDTRGLASGVYLLVMDAEKDGQAAVRAVRKLLIIK